MPSIEHDFLTFLGDKWLPIASSFIRQFGGLTIAHRLCIWREPASTDHMLLKLEDRIAAAVKSRVVAVASGNYLGDGSVIWIDMKGRFFAADSEGLVYLGSDVSEVLDVLLLGAHPADGPLDIEEGLRNAREWDVEEKMSAI